jgi:AcrR family transcriptional regulator
MPRVKKHDLLVHALELAQVHGYNKVTRDGIADRSGVAMGTVTNQLGTMQQLRRSIVRHAIRTENLAIVAQAVALKDPLVKKIDQDLKQRALASL